MLDVINRARDPLVVRRERLSADQLSELAAVPDSMVPSLAAVAHETRLAWRGDAVEVEGILSAKTGGCPEDCHFCAQSARFDTPVLATPFLDTDQVLEAARQTATLGATEFCIVLAVRGPDERTMRRLLELATLIHEGDRAQCSGIGRDPHTGPGPAPGSRWRPPVQPQPGDGPVLFPERRHHPQLGGALPDLP